MYVVACMFSHRCFRLQILLNLSTPKNYQHYQTQTQSFIEDLQLRNRIYWILICSAGKSLSENLTPIFKHLNRTLNVCFVSAAYQQFLPVIFVIFDKCFMSHFLYIVHVHGKALYFVISNHCCYLLGLSYLVPF